MTAFSVTEVESFLRCRRNWNITSFNRWSLSHSGAGNINLDLGSLIHQSLADWTVDSVIVGWAPAALSKLEVPPYADDDWAPIPFIHPRAKAVNAGYEIQDSKLVDLFHVRTAMKLDKIKARYYARVGMRIGRNELASIYEAHELGASMMVNYQDYHGSPLPKHMQFVSPEQEVAVPVKGTEHKCPTCNGQKTIIRPEIHARYECADCRGTGVQVHYLKGTLDALVMDTKDRLFIIEHKTYGARPNEASLKRNFQFTAYIWMLHQLDMGRVGGLAYDGMWKRSAPPRGKTMDDLFLRHIEYRNQTQLDKFALHLPSRLNEMARIPQVAVLDDHPDLYTTVPWKGCFDCTVSDLCTAMERGENARHVLENSYELREKDDPIGIGSTDE